MPCSTMADTDWVTVRIPRAARKDIDKILEHVSQAGWQSVGVTRYDTPTIGTVLAAAVTTLADRVKSDTTLADRARTAKNPPRGGR